MDECGGLENRYGRKALLGSNPSPSEFDIIFTANFWRGRIARFSAAVC